MPLITTIAEIRDAGVPVNFVNDDSNIPDIITAELLFIKPVLGNDLYAAVIAAPGSKPALLPYIQRALAPLAYWLNLSTVQTQITDRGVANAISDNMQAAHRWEYEALKNNLEMKGCLALEQLIEFLSIPVNTTLYSWTVPEEYNLLFRTGADFNKAFTINQPYRNFLQLRPCLADTEEHYLIASIGEDFFEEMKALQLPADKTSWTDDQKKQGKALKLLKKAAAHLTIAKSTELLPVKISGNGFTVSLGDAVDKPNPQEQQSPDTQLYVLRNSARSTGERYLVELKDFLNKNAGDALFATFKNSEYYTAPPTGETVDKNSCRKIFTL